MEAQDLRRLQNNNYKIQKKYRWASRIKTDSEQKPNDLKKPQNTTTKKKLY